MKCPTPEECTANATYDDGNGMRWMACWYPQMDGYGGQCLVRVGTAARIDVGEDCTDECFEAYVWHDGQWPFNDSDSMGRSPAHIHHCGAYQFIEFGKLIAKAQGTKVVSSRGPECAQFTPCAALSEAREEILELRDRAVLAPEAILAEFERRMDSYAETIQDTSLDMFCRFAVGMLRDIVKFPHLIGTQPSLDLPLPYEPPPGPPKTDTELLEAILREELMAPTINDPVHGQCQSLYTWAAINEALYTKGLRPRPERKKKDTT